MNNLQDNGWDFSDVKRIPLGLKQARRYRLKRGDLLFNRTNSKELVGKCAVFREPGVWVFASYLIRARLNEAKMLPEFAALFLSTPAGRIQIDRISRQIIGMTNINAEELKRLLIPCPPLYQQKELVAAMEMARASRRAKLAKADELLVSLDGYLLERLMLSSSHKSRKVFAIQAKQLTNALNIERYIAFQLERYLKFATLVDDAAKILSARCVPSREEPEDDWDWIRIDDLPGRPWEVEAIRTVKGREIQGAVFEVQENDILLARLGPTILNAKFVLCPKPKRKTVASPEFLVLRCREGWNPDTVLWVLRMRLYRDIMYARSRGGTPSRYRLDSKDLASIPFPSLDMATQTDIANEVQRRRKEARRLRIEAEAEWQEAKKWFEEQLLGKE